jgi:multiple sugar transport system substrate-binding protein
MLKKRILALAIVSILLTTTLGLGCKGPSATEQAAIRPAVLNYWTVFDDVSMLRRFADEYSASKPYLTINIRQVRYEEFDTLFVNALADDIGPDIISVHTRWLRKYQPRLAAMPSSVTTADVYIKGEYTQELVIDNKQRAMPTLNTLKSSYISTVADDVVIGGQTYGLPLAVDTLALYYNKDLLDRAGIATPPTTWEEFLEAVQQSTRFNSTGAIVQSGVALGTGNNIDNAPDILTLLMMQKGVEVTRGSTVLFDTNIKQLKSTHPTLEALRFYTDFARPNKEVYSWNADKDDALSAFVRGQSVFYIGYAFDQSRIRVRAPQMNLAIIPMPQLDPSNPVNVANYWVESVVAKSRQKDLAWDFIRFITNPENTKAYASATRQPSPYRAHVSDYAEDPLLSPFASQILTAKNWYKGSNVDVANRALSNLIDQYLEPYSVDISEDKRDVELIENAARIIQQTM